MDYLPSTWLEGLSNGQAAAVAAWWRRLSEADRSELAAPLPAEGDGSRVIGGCFAPNDDTSGWLEWFDARVEELAALPDPAFDEPFYWRRFCIGGPPTGHLR